MDLEDLKLEPSPNFGLLIVAKGDLDPAKAANPPEGLDYMDSKDSFQIINKRRSGEEAYEWFGRHG